MLGSHGRCILEGEEKLEEGLNVYAKRGVYWRSLTGCKVQLWLWGRAGEDAHGCRVLSLRLAVPQKKHGG